MEKGDFGKKQKAKESLPSLSSAGVFDQTDDEIFDGVSHFHRGIKVQFLKIAPTQLVRETTLAPGVYLNTAATPHARRRTQQLSRGTRGTFSTANQRRRRCTWAMTPTWLNGTSQALAIAVLIVRMPCLMGYADCTVKIGCAPSRQPSIKFQCPGCGCIIREFIDDVAAYDLVAERQSNA